MKQFEHMNTNGDAKCPICGTGDDKPVVLAGIEGTEDGNNMQAMQVHVDCINLTYKTGVNGIRSILYQICEEVK